MYYALSLRKLNKKVSVYSSALTSGVGMLNCSVQLGESASNNDVCRWHKQYDVMGVDQLKELKRLLRENEQLRKATTYSLPCHLTVSF